MPIVDIEIVGPLPAGCTAPLAQRLADAAGRVFAAPPGTTWARVRALPLDAYAENEAAVEPADAPVFVTVRKRRAPEGAELAAEAAALTRAVAGVLERDPGRVHVGYEASAAGRMAFGGTLVD
jgi:phenylpyruvate tautomerase PptA (4-oxalocrotonate tautomerase family)